MRTLIAAVLVSTLLVAACGAELSLIEYADQLEAGVTAMNGRLDELDAELRSPSDLEQVKRYANERVAARNRFNDVLNELDPPDVVSDLHNAALGIIGRLVDAESALAEYVDGLDSPTDLEEIWSTPLGVAARSADEEAVALCLAAQAELDSTEERSDLEELPWIPPELKEVVLVAFGCLAEER
jgi:hypothetical protein